MLAPELRKCGRIRPTAAQKRAIPMLLDHTAPLPIDTAPVSVNNSHGAPIAMAGNDQYGDCTVAGVANFFAVCSKLFGFAITIVTAAIVDFYMKMTGGADNGLNEIDVMKKIHADGIDVGDGVVRKTAIWARVPLKNHQLVKYLIWKLGGIYLGASLPNFALSSDAWKAPTNLEGDNAPNPENGHCFLVTDYAPTVDGVTPCTFITWGMGMPGDLGFSDDFCDEGYVMIDAELAQLLGADWDAMVAIVQNVPSA